MINDREVSYARRNTVVNENNGRSLSAVINDLKIDGKAFLNTRLEMLQAEMQEKIGAFKSAMPMLVVGIVFGVTAWLVLTAAIICIIAVAFGPGMMSWFYATLIVGGVYLIVGGAAAFFAIGELKRANLKPERTLRVLKQDQVFLRNESSSVVNEVKQDVSLRRAA